ncbi:ABC transporter permease [Vallitalea sediminicola]
MLNIIKATIKKNRYIIKRAYPYSFIVGRVINSLYTPLFAYFIFKFTFNESVNEEYILYSNNMDYMTYMVLGAAVYIFAIATLMNVGRSLMNELREGTLELLIYSPASRIGYFLGTLIEQLLRTIVEITIILIIGWALGADYSSVSIIDVILIFIIAVASFFSMSILLAAVMLKMRDTYITQNTLFNIMLFLCGVSYPIKFLPNILQKIAHLLPLTQVLQLFRGSFMHKEIDIGLVIELIVLSVVYFTIGYRLIVKEERKFIENTFA